MIRKAEIGTPEGVGAIVLFTLLLSANVWGQVNDSKDSKGFTFDEQVQSSVNSLGAVTRFDTSAGYAFSPHWSASLGVPWYVVAPVGSGAFEDIGNVYARIRFSNSSPELNYASTLTVTAPTGNRNEGLSTGHATVDWSNDFARGFGRVTPFAEIGFANAVSDTESFVRPYTTSGFITHLQAGARLRVTSWMSVNASGYVIQPAGQQTVVSRVVRVKQQGTPGSGPPVFETTTVTTGPAGIARDRGFSAWVVLGPPRIVNVYGGFTRSAEFDLNTAFFGVAVNLRKTLGLIGL